MRALRLMIFLLLASAVVWGDGYYCDCYSYIYVDANSGAISSVAYSSNDYCIESCYADVTMSFGDNNGEIFNGSNEDDYSGYAQIEYDGYVELNDTYWEDSNHYVEGYDDYYDYFTDSADWSEQTSIPGFPSVWTNYVDVSYPYVGYVDFTVSPPVLSSAQMSLGGQYAFAGGGQTDYRMTFDESQVPYGTSGITFTGYMYGLGVSPTVGYATRVSGNTQGDPKSQYATCAGENLGILTQAFFLKTSETWDVFSYTLPTNGPTVLATRGTADASTDAAAECGFDFVTVAAQNTVTDPAGHYWSADMSPPTGPTLPPQGPYYQSRDNYWFEWLQHGGNGNICVQFIPGTDVGVAAFVAFPCSNVILP